MDEAKIIEIVLTFESDQPFTEWEIGAIARRAARFADTAADELSHPSAQIDYGVEVKKVAWVTAPDPTPPAPGDPPKE